MTTFLGNPVTLVGEALQVGQQMPDFEVIDTTLAPVHPMETKGKKIILAVPSADTGVCSLELAKFMNKMRGNEEVEVISVSEDLPFALDRWSKAEGNDVIHTYSDYKDHDFANKTGTYMKENGLLARSVFVTDEDGKIVYLEYVDEVSHEPDYKKALAAAGVE
ncbi:thiol peroxidase [Erysipelotrichaceae bacterium RD49]|nr:thiol peroxidase [Erysipelotrichaceae bacterium RD49]